MRKIFFPVERFQQTGQFRIGAVILFFQTDDQGGDPPFQTLHQPAAEDVEAFLFLPPDRVKQGIAHRLFQGAAQELFKGGQVFFQIGGACRRVRVEIPAALRQIVPDEVGAVAEPEKLHPRGRPGKTAFGQGLSADSGADHICLKITHGSE